MNKEIFCGVDLIWDDFYWSGKSSVFAGVELQINSENEKPVKPCLKQESAWIEFCEMYPAIYPKILSAVLTYYQEFRIRSLRSWPDLSETLPVIKSEELIENTIRLYSITIGWPYGVADVELGLSYYCTWDEEHSLGVVVSGSNVVNVGGADCAIL